MLEDFVFLDAFISGDLADCSFFKEDELSGSEDWLETTGAESGFFDESFPNILLLNDERLVSGPCEDTISTLDFGRFLPYLYRWNIPAKTSIIIPTKNNEKFFIPLKSA